jgi:hypothetical protein
MPQREFGAVSKSVQAVAWELLTRLVAARSTATRLLAACGK